MPRSCRTLAFKQSACGSQNGHDLLESWSREADVVELVDTLVLEASASAWEFESPHPHHAVESSAAPSRCGSGCVLQAVRLWRAPIILAAVWIDLYQIPQFSARVLESPFFLFGRAPGSHILCIGTGGDAGFQPAQKGDGRRWHCPMAIRLVPYAMLATFPSSFAIMPRFTEFWSACDFSS
jgi:hypothetical protein